jgi:hypothetical protein
VERIMTKSIALTDSETGDRPVQLETSERLLLWGFRTLAQHRGCECPVMAVIHQTYIRFGIEDALAPLATVVELFATSAHTPISLHSSSCPCLSADERLLLDATAAAQSGDLRASRKGFEYWLASMAAGGVAEAAYAIGKAFRKANFELPDPRRNTPDLDPAHAPQVRSVGSGALH